MTNVETNEEPLKGIKKMRQYFSVANVQQENVLQKSTTGSSREDDEQESRVQFYTTINLEPLADEILQEELEEAEEEEQHLTVIPKIGARPNIRNIFPNDSETFNMEEEEEEEEGIEEEHYRDYEGYENDFENLKSARERKRMQRQRQQYVRTVEVFTNDSDIAPIVRAQRPSEDYNIHKLPSSARQVASRDPMESTSKEPTHATTSQKTVRIMSKHDIFAESQPKEATPVEKKVSITKDASVQTTFSTSHESILESDIFDLEETSIDSVSVESQ